MSARHSEMAPRSEDETYSYKHHPTQIFENSYITKGAPPLNRHTKVRILVRAEGA